MSAKAASDKDEIFLFLKKLREVEEESVSKHRVERKKIFFFGEGLREGYQNVFFGRFHAFDFKNFREKSKRRRQSRRWPRSYFREFYARLDNRNKVIEFIEKTTLRDWPDPERFRRSSS